MKWLRKRKPIGIRDRSGYLSKSKTPTSGKTIFVEPKENSSLEESFSKQATKCTTCNKSKYVANECFSRYFENY